MYFFELVRKHSPHTMSHNHRNLLEKWSRHEGMQPSFGVLCQTTVISAVIIVIRPRKGVLMNDEREKKVVLNVSFRLTVAS